MSAPHQYVAAPIPGMTVVAPTVVPAPGQVVVGYEVYKPQIGCCEFTGMRSEGIIAIIILAICFWPLAWIPCFMDECYDNVQRPVYGWPAAYPQSGMAPQQYNNQEWHRNNTTGGVVQGVPQGAGYVPTPSFNATQQAPAAVFAPEQQLAATPTEDASAPRVVATKL